MQFLRKFAWIGGALGALMVIAFIAHRVTTGTFDATWSGLGAGGAALLMLYLWLDRDELASATGGRGARYSTMAVLLTLVAAGLAVAVNVLAGLLPVVSWAPTRCIRWSSMRPPRRHPYLSKRITVWRRSALWKVLEK